MPTFGMKTVLTSLQLSGIWPKFRHLSTDISTSHGRIKSSVTCDIFEKIPRMPGGLKGEKDLIAMQLSPYEFTFHKKKF